MEATAENIQVLVAYLTQTLSPEYEVRKPAEDYLMTVEKQAGYSILLLQLADSEQVELPIRLAAVINFKNFVKRNWRIVDGESKVGQGRGQSPKGGWGGGGFNQESDPTFNFAKYARGWPGSSNSMTTSDLHEFLCTAKSRV